MDIVGGKLFSNNPKNINHVHKDTKDLLSIIITLGTDIRGGDTMFYDGVKKYDLVSKAHAQKHLHGRAFFGPFEKCYHKCTIWRGPISVISFIIKKQTFIHFYHHADLFITNISIK